jgi:hypothetical protein
VVALALVVPALAHADNITNMVWHNGTVMTTSTTYAIFWLPPGTHFEPSTGNATTDAANDQKYEDLIKRYFQDVGGSDLYATTTQYTGSNGAVANNSTFGGSTVAVDAYPHAGTTTDRLTQDDLKTEVDTVRKAQGWPTGVTNEYFIYTGYQIQSVDNGGNKSATDYCAYHSHFDSGGTVVWANMPDAKSLASPSVCDDFNVNGDSYADVEVTQTSHEHMEAITNPEGTKSSSGVYGGGWFDDVDHFAGENGDKCAYTYGITNSIGANIYMNGHPYKVQREWSNIMGDGATTYRGCALSYNATTGIREPVLTFSNTAAPATIAGNPSDSVNVTLVATDPDNAEPATSAAIATTLPAGLSRTGGAALSVSVGSLGVHDSSTNVTSVSPNTPLLDGTVLTVSSQLSYSDSLCADKACTSSGQDRAQTAITQTSTITVSNSPPSLVLPAAQSQDYHDALSFGISATDADAGDTIKLSASGLPAGLSFTDNGDRTGTVSGTLTATPGTYVVTFTADDQHHVAPVTGTVTITVTREETTLTYNGPTVILQGGSGATLQAQLLEDGTTAPSPAGQTITLSLGGKSCTGTTDATGTASCPVTFNGALGSQPLSAVFAGDTYYLPSSDTGKTATVFAFPSRGAFVLGDQTVAAATASTSVNWWSDSWWSLNSLTGGTAPLSFKGFAGTVTTLPTKSPANSCGTTFLTLPGNSPPPTSGVPSYMGVIVASSVTKQGNGIGGTWGKIVVVKTDSGYAPSPGHPGTGQIVGVFC